MYLLPVGKVIMVEGRRWVWRCTTPPTVHRLAVTRALCFVATLGCVDAEDAGDENAELHGNHYKDEKPLLRAAHCKKKKHFSHIHQNQC